MFIKDLARQRERNPFLRLGEWVYQRLHGEITALNLLPGTKLNESKLAAELNISRSPIKYAIERLTEERLVVKQGKAAVVSVVDKIECAGLCEARLGIECHAAFLATKRISKGELKRLGTLARGYTHIANGPNVASCVDCDQEFHGIIIAACRNSCRRTSGCSGRAHRAGRTSRSTPIMRARSSGTSSPWRCSRRRCGSPKARALPRRPGPSSGSFRWDLRRRAS